MNKKIIEWHDKETAAVGWIVIDTLINGVSGGGLFISSDANLEEVSDLAYTMSLKNSLQNPIFGGAKAGIRFDPDNPMSPGVIRRFLLDNKDIFENEFCTGADINTTNEFIENVFKKDINYTSAFLSLSNMLYRKEGISDQSSKLLGRLHNKIIDGISLGDSATGFSIAATIKSLCGFSPKVIIQGFGKVGKSLSYFLSSKNIGTVVGISDKNEYIYSENGIDTKELITIKSLKNNGMGFSFADILSEDKKIEYNFTVRKREQTDEEFFCSLLSKQKADVLSPCATRYCITMPVLKEFHNNNKRYIISGANNVFSKNININNIINDTLIIVPEWLSNCGNAILFLECLKKKQWGPGTVQEIFKIIECRIAEHIQKSLCVNSNLFYNNCIKVAINRLKNMG